MPREGARLTQRKLPSRGGAATPPYQRDMEITDAALREKYKVLSAQLDERSLREQRQLYFTAPTKP
jgi:hypothetical protein